jgi:hypothetical protein
MELSTITRQADLDERSLLTPEVVDFVSARCTEDNDVIDHQSRDAHDVIVAG